MASEYADIYNICYECENACGIELIVLLYLWSKHGYTI